MDSTRMLTLEFISKFATVLVLVNITVNALPVPISAGLKAQGAYTADVTRSSHTTHCDAVAPFLPVESQGATSSEVCARYYEQYRHETSLPRPVSFNTPVTTAVLISMLNATLQTHHTLTQLYDTLMKLLNSNDTSCASSFIPVTSCHQLTCVPLFLPELKLACDLEDRVLPEVSNLIGVLRRESQCLPNTCLQDVKYADIDSVRKPNEVRYYSVLGTHYGMLQTDATNSALQTQPAK